MLTSGTGTEFQQNGEREIRELIDPSWRALPEVTG
jgi:hypothetical protein